MADEPKGILTTLYVQRFDPKPSVAHLRKKEPVPVAVEFLHRKDAEELVKYLQERLAEEGTGAVRATLWCDVSHV